MKPAPRRIQPRCNGHRDLATVARGHVSFATASGLRMPEGAMGAPQSQLRSPWRQPRPLLNMASAAGVSAIETSAVLPADGDAHRNLRVFSPALCAEHRGCANPARRSFNALFIVWLP